MNKFERVKNIFDKKPVDRVPVSMWHHFDGEDKFGQKFVDSHYKYYKNSNIDFLKIMNDAFFPFPIDTKIQRASDWKNLRPMGKKHKYIREQAEYAARMNDKLQGDCMTFWTVFAPFSSMRFTVGDPMVTEHLKEDPKSVIQAMKVVAEDCADVAELCTTIGGCSGSYIALHSADEGRFTEEQYMEWIKPQDLMVVDRMNETSNYNIGHLCGWSQIPNNMDWWMDYPLQLMNWACYIDDVSWEQGGDYFKDVIRMGGFDSREQGLIYTGTKEEIKNETKRLLSISGTENVILGADCTVPMDINPERISWVVEASEEFGNGR